MLPLEDALRDDVPHVLCVALPHCDWEGVKLEETHAEPVRLTVTEEEEEGVKEVECVPLELPLSVVLHEPVAQALSEALPHCEREGVKLVETHAEPLGLPDTEEEDDGVQEEECVPLGLLLAEAHRDAVAQAL